MAADCLCPTLPDLAHIPMGTHDGRDARFLDTVEVSREAGSTQWWLYLARCRVCAQYWLVAQEERIYDEHLLARLSEARANAILDTEEWPEIFKTYESVLTVARKLSHPGRFLDPMAGSLLWTVEDLRRERPNIAKDEIAQLLGIGRRHVCRLIARNEATSIGQRLRRWLVPHRISGRPD